MHQRRRNKRRIRPIGEGRLARIRDLLFPILMQGRPRNHGHIAWLEKMFNTETRDIVHFRANQSFALPGLLRIGPYRRQPLTGHRKIKRGEQIWIRTDSTRPDAIDVEVYSGVGRKEELYQLTREQLASILPALQRIKHCEDK